MSCSIIRKPNGVVEVTEDVQLFNELVQETGSQLAALDMWAVAQMDEFEQAGYEKTSKDIRTFLDSYASTQVSLSPSETFEVKSFMKENGISTLSELHDMLTDVFKPEGEFVVDFNRMIQSGLYNESDLSVFDEDVVMDLMSKIESAEDFFVDVNVEAMYTDTETKTVFGTSSKITENDIYRELMDTVEDFQDEAAIGAAVNELGYTDFTEKFNTDKKFAGEIIEKLSQLKRVPVLHIENGQLIEENLNTKKTVDATLLVGLDTLTLEADIEYLSEISPEIWQAKIENVRGVVKDIEASLVAMNVDVIGMSQAIERRDDIIDLLLAAQAMLTNPTPGNIREFASRKDDLVPADNNTVVLNLPEQYRSLNIVRLSTDKSQAELFEEFGLLKVGPSLYHKVSKGEDFVTAAYELLYQRVLDGTLEVPKEFRLAAKEDKPGVLEDLSKFVMSRNIGFKTLDHELVSLSQLVFNHEAVDKAKLVEKASQASTIQSEVDYLAGDFITDFYNYYLEQKLANTSLYRNVLSKFEFKENDITLREPVFSRDMKYYQELQDYMKLKVDMGVDMDVDYKPFFVDEDIRAINNPELISEYPGQTFQNGNYLVAKANNTQYIKKDGELYRRVLKGDNSTVFAMIQTAPGTVYMQVGNNFDINVEEAQQVLDVYDKEFKTSLTTEQYKEKLKKAGTDGTIKAPKKEFEISSVDDKPGMSVMRVGDSQVFFKEKVNPDGSTTNQIELDLITTKEGKRDKGSARKALQTFLNYTDSLGKDVYLFAQPRDRQTSVEGLIKFYKSEGFRSTSEFLPEEMVRRAKSSVNQQVIGESAVLSQQESDSLRQAKQMELQGEGALAIELQTGWFKEAGKWKMFSREMLSKFNILESVTPKSGETYLLEELINNPELFRAYPDIAKTKIKFDDRPSERNDGLFILGLQRGGEIVLNALESDFGPGVRAEGVNQYPQVSLNQLFRLRESGREMGQLSDSVLNTVRRRVWQSTLVHEVQHLVQVKEGFPTGGVPSVFRSLAETVLGGLRGVPLGRVKQYYEENKGLVSEKDRPVVEVYIDAVDEAVRNRDLGVIERKLSDKYRLLMGEVEARTLEYALGSGEVNSDTPFSVLRDRLLKLEGLDGQNLIPYTTNQEVVSAVVDKLKQTGLATDVIQMSTQEIEDKLKELGFDDNVVQQVIAWHGTQNKAKDLSIVDFKNEKRYGELLSGTYYGNKSIAAGFAGMFDGSTLFKAQIDESSFVEVDMRGTTPTGTQELVEVIGQEAYDKLLDDKRSGKIKGLILKNSFEKDYPVGTTTQYLVFDPAVVQVMDKFVGNRLDNEVFDVFGIALQIDTPTGEVVKLTPQGFVHNKVVYLNTEAVDPINTSIHEFGHLYLDALKENFTDKYNAGLSLVDKYKDTEAKEYVEYVKTTQPNLKEGTEAFKNEVLAQVIGDNGAKLVRSKEKNSIKEWLSDLWNTIKELVGLSSMTAEQVSNMSLQEFAEAVSVDLLGGNVLTGNRAQEYFTREADRLPLTLAVFQRPEFVKMQGKMVNTITVLNSLNQSGIKQIEKDLIKNIIEENYQGQKKISYDELEAKVRANIMPLERIFTSSYANYGMDNLGDGNYGEASTIILNSPIEHGVIGHFPGDFIASGRKNINYVAKQLNDNTWVAVEEGYESQGVNENNIYQFVGTAGTKEAVESWIDNRSSVKPFYVADKSNIKNPIKFFDTYKEAKQWASENGENLTAEDSEGINREINKGMFGHIRVWQDGAIFNVAELQSDYFQENNAKKDLLFKNEQYKKIQDEIISKKKNIDRKEAEIDSEKYKVSVSDWENYAKDILDSGKYNISYEDSLSEDMFKEPLTKVEIRDNNVLVYRGVFKRGSRYDVTNPNYEAIPKLIGEGLQLGIATNLAESAKSKGIEFKTSNENILLLEDELGKLKSELVDLNKNLAKAEENIVRNLPKDKKQFIASQKEWEKRVVREAIKEASLSGATSLRFPTPYTLSVIEGFISVEGEKRKPYEVVGNPSKEILEVGDKVIFLGKVYTVCYASNNSITVYPEDVAKFVLLKKEEKELSKKEDKLEDEGLNRDDKALKEIRARKREIRKKFEESGRDFYANIEGGETLSQPIDYKVSEGVFSIENSLSDTQQTVARKYEQIAEILKQERGDNFEVITDKNGFTWYETKIGESEMQQPVTAFQYQAPPTSNPIMTEKYKNQDIDGVAAIIDNNIEFLFNVDEGLIDELDCQI